MKLYVIRHGQSEGNIRGVFSGWLQHNLTEKGREDARSDEKWNMMERMFYLYD